jgi:ABC-type amino acid transport substrate-binding protein
MQRRLLSAVVAAAVATATLVCTASARTHAQTPPPTRTKGVLLVGSDIPYVPFGFGKPPNYTGFDIELSRAIAGRLGLKLKVEKTPFDTIFRDLAQGRFDMVASSSTITAEREKVVAFSLPYFDADQSLMVKRGSSIRSTKDLAEKKVGVQIGGTPEIWARKNLKSTQIRTYDTTGDAFNALAAGQVDGVINDFPSSKYAERQYRTLVVVQTIPTHEQYGIAFAKSSNVLRQRVNEAMLALKKDGAFAALYKKWFSIAPPADVLRARR